jgi:hypothetical protein
MTERDSRCYATADKQQLRRGVFYAVRAEAI